MKTKTKTKTSLLVVILCVLCVSTLLAKPTSGSEAARFVIFGPKPHYPIGARQMKVTGCGTYILKINSHGAVVSVRPDQSTGSPILDRAAMSGFVRWRFKPGSVSEVKMPVCFAMPGSYYDTEVRI